MTIFGLFGLKIPNLVDFVCKIVQFDFMNKSNLWTKIENRAPNVFIKSGVYCSLKFWFFPEKLFGKNRNKIYMVITKALTKTQNLTTTEQIKQQRNNKLDLIHTTCLTSFGQLICCICISRQSGRLLPETRNGLPLFPAASF